MIMCEDDKGHVRMVDENALMALSTEEFFIKLLVFKERMELRIKNAKPNG